MTIWKLVAAVAIAGNAAAPLPAAFGDDPEWPCVQRRVDHLSLAVMWPEPVPLEAELLEDEWNDVAEAMALRRVSIDEVEALVDAVAAEHNVDGSTYGRLFAAAFDRIDRRRTRIIEGIVRYARGQAELAEEIDALRTEFVELETAAEPDFDRLDALEAEIDWRERVFEDRNAALTYVCETPVLLERRAYELAQRLLARTD